MFQRLWKMYTTSSLMRVRLARRHVLALLLFSTICFLVFWHASLATWWSATPKPQPQPVQAGRGGTWHIPKSWTSDDISTSGCNATQFAHIVDAAECALSLSLANNAFMDNSQIPLIAHQTARSADPDTWPKVIRKCIDRWLAAANGSDGLAGPEMAWFMWDDEGIREVVQKYEHNLYPAFSALPYPVEKADVFRVIVLKWFGGVYGDIDSIPLIHPSHWIETNDIQPWYDEAGNKSIQQQPLEASLTTPADAPASYKSRTSSMTVKKDIKKKTVNAVFGIEADNLPEPDDTYWRMGYTFPVQVTNWALAMAPHHPVATQFLSDVAAKVEADKAILPTIDPLDITGPPALTRTLKNYTESVESDFTWQSLSSRGSHVRGGISKIVASDILILPITGFSPGRGWYQNMGSQPMNHPAARLQHLAAGSWKTPNLFVTYGKLCRTVFGRCREWSKIPPPKR